MQLLEVPGHVFVCVDGEYVVLLDLRNDRYWALEAAKTQALAHRVRGWPARPSDHEEHSASRSNPGTMRLLVEKGLLCDARDSSKDATPVRVDPPRSELMNDAGVAQPGARGAMSFLLAAAVAAAEIRCKPFEQVINHARRRKQGRGESAAMLDVAQAAQLVCSFERLRPLLFSARGACLFNSLVLLEFLARHDLFPQWVFGVQARPFAAHCWVQQDGILFNDTIDHVRRYTPIMAI